MSVCVSPVSAAPFPAEDCDSFRLNCAELLRALKYADSARDKSLRYKGLCLDWRAGILSIVGTDGRRIHVTEIQCPDCPEDGAFVLDSLAVDLLLTALKALSVRSAETVTLTFDRVAGRFRAESTDAHYQPIRIEGAQDPGRFPNWRDIVGQFGNRKGEIGVPHKALVTLRKQKPKRGESRRLEISPVPMATDSYDSGVVVRVVDCDKEPETALEFNRFTSGIKSHYRENFDLWIALPFLLEALPKTSKGETVVIESINGISPVRVRKEQGNSYAVLMPLSQDR